jgi:ech hydrogenase subunit C
MIYSASGCGACGSGTRSCFSPVFNIRKYGFYLTGNPKIADALVISGSLNSRSARVVKNIRAAMPAGSHVISVGDCAIDGCRMADSKYDLTVENVVDVDQAVKGCPCGPQELINSLVSLFEHPGGGKQNEHH